MNFVIPSANFVESTSVFKWQSITNMRNNQSEWSANIILTALQSVVNFYTIDDQISRTSCCIFRFIWPTMHSDLEYFHRKDMPSSEFKEKAPNLRAFTQIWGNWNISSLYLTECSQWIWSIFNRSEMYKSNAFCDWIMKQFDSRHIWFTKFAVFGFDVHLEKKIASIYPIHLFISSTLSSAIGCMRMLTSTLVARSSS
jgi:hypothetical protein